MDCKAETNRSSCPCTSKDCERQGICCDCLRAHLSRRSLPACMRNLEWIAIQPEK